jgi:hypothetical protein
MSPDDLRHEGTLLGALDSYLSALARVRPHLTGAHRQILEKLDMS